MRHRHRLVSQRAALAGRPDAITSTTDITAVPGGRLLTITWRDQDDGPVTVPFAVEVTHAPASAAASAIGVHMKMSQNTAGSATKLQQQKSLIKEGNSFNSACLRIEARKISAFCTRFLN